MGAEGPVAGGLALLVVACAALVLGAVLVVRSQRDAVGLLTILVVAVFVFPARVVVGPLGAAGTPAAIVGVLLCAWWALGRISPRVGFDTGKQPVRWVAIAFFCIMLIGYAHGYMRLLSGAEARSADREVIGMLVLLGAVLVAADGIMSRVRLEVLLRRLVLAATVFAGIGILQYFLALDISGFYQGLPGLRVNTDLAEVGTRGAVSRVFATATHPIEFGVVLALVLPLALHFALFARGRRELQKRWLCVVLIAVAVPMSVSRSAILALVVAMVVLVLGWGWRRRINAIAISIGFIIAVGATIPGLIGTIRNLFTGYEDDPSIAARTNDFEIVENFVLESPLIGRGLGTFIPEQYTLLDNEYFLTTIETGFLGVVALIGLFLIGFSVAREARRNVGDDAETANLAQSIAASIAGAGIAFATFDAIFFRINATIVFLLIGCAGALWRLTRAGDDAGTAPQLELASNAS